MGAWIKSLLRNLRRILRQRADYYTIKNTKWHTIKRDK